MTVFVILLFISTCNVLVNGYYQQRLLYLQDTIYNAQARNLANKFIVKKHHEKKILSYSDKLGSVVLKDEKLIVTVKHKQSVSFKYSDLGY